VEKGTATRQAAAKNPTPTSLGLAPAPQLAANPVLCLQRSIGNQAVLRLLHNGILQAKLASSPPGDPYEQEADRAAEQVTGRTGTAIIQRKCSCGGGCPSCEKEKRIESDKSVQLKLAVSAPGDPYEQEADHVAERVMRMPDPGAAAAASTVAPAVSGVQRKCACGGTCPRCQEEQEGHGHGDLQMKAAGPGSAGGIEAPPAVHEALRTPGQPLDAATRSFMEPRFGQDFSNVRLHADSQAAASAQDVNAHAYTVGRDIVFGPGRLAPSTDAGRRLIAHELTHVVQQEQTRVAGVQRSPDQFLECTTCHKPMSGSYTPFVIPSTHVETDDKDPLYFGPAPVICSNCHQNAERGSFPTHKQAGGKRVNYQNIVDWAVEETFTLAMQGKGRDTIFSTLQRQEDQKLPGIWAWPMVEVIETLAYAERDRHPVFTGSNAARTRYAAHLEASRGTLLERLKDRAIDKLVQEIKEANRTYHCRGALLVTEPKRFKSIEDTPDTKGVTLPISFGTDVWKPKLEIGPIRVRSAGGGTLAYEVIGHEGIYFETSTTAMTNYGCTTALTVRESVKGGVFFNEIWKGVEKFSKGLLTAAASPVEMLIETAAQIIDLASQSIAALGEWRGWYHIGYTCFSSACKKAEACLDDGKSVRECQDIGLREAAEAASVVIPLYRQGRACLEEGNLEACGSIAPMFIGLVPKGPRLKTLAEIERAEASAAKGGKLPAKGEREPTLASAAGGEKALTSAEFEDAAIRESIGRRRAGDPHIAEALEGPRVEKPPAPKPRKPATQKDVEMDRAVHQSAREAGSELQLDDEKHGIAAYGKGEEAGLRFCSEPYCSLVREKVGTILDELPKDYDPAMRSDLRHLYLRIEPIERLLKSKQITEIEANRFSHEIAKELESYAQRDRSIGRLLKKTTEELRANRAQITRELEGLTEPPERPRTQPGTRGTAGTRAARTYRIRNTDSAAFAESQRGYQVYEYRNAKGELLYVGKSGGAGGKNPMNWPDRLKNEHIKTEWIGEASTVNVTSGLGEQEAFALEEVMIPKAKYNKKPGEYSSRFPQGNVSANAAAASKHGVQGRFSLDVMF
jgi:hypothetical protein